MKKPVILILLPILFMSVTMFVAPQYFGSSLSASTSTPHKPVAPDSSAVASHRALETALEEKQLNTRQMLVKYAMTLMGSPYVYAGMSRSGFDCSGFTTYVYKKFGVEVPHSSRMQAEQGHKVPRHQAEPGDLVIFTGTNPKVRKPGHVGIVISQPGDTIEFVHSSSVGGVKVSKIEGSRYDLRFLQIRRVL